MSFNYIEHRRKSDKKNTPSDSSKKSSVSSEGSKEETQGFPMVKESVGGSSKEEEAVPERVCEECKEIGIDDKLASRKVRMSGREEWLCDSCLQAAGYEGELD